MRVATVEEPITVVGLIVADQFAHHLTGFERKLNLQSIRYQNIGAIMDLALG